jgi:hypothetical protein
MFSQLKNALSATPNSPAPPPPPRKDPRARALVAQEALSGLQGDTLANVVYTILVDHSGMTGAHLHALANRLSRAADEKERSNVD